MSRNNKSVHSFSQLSELLTQPAAPRPDKTSDVGTVAQQQVSAAPPPPP